MRFWGRFNPAKSAAKVTAAMIGPTSDRVVVVAFSARVSAISGDYGQGVTIRVEGRVVPILWSLREGGEMTLQHALSLPVQVGETVTWSYDAGRGSLVTESGGKRIASVKNWVVLNRIAARSGMLDFSVPANFRNLVLLG